MMELSSNQWSTAMANKYLTMETIIKDSIKWEGFMGKVDIFGKMDHLMMEVLYKVIGKGSGDGNQVVKTLIYTLDNINSIKNKGKDNIHGVMDAYTMGILSTT